MDIGQEIYPQVRRIVADHMGLPLVSLRPDSRITEDLGAGPLDHLELIMTIEEHFDILFPQDERSKMITLWDVVERISNLFKH